MSVWTYTSGYSNSRFANLVVPVGGDGSRPSGWVYVAKDGNDSTGNGSRSTPYLTIARAVTELAGAAGKIVVNAGTYGEHIGAFPANSYMIADGAVIIDLTSTGSGFYTGNGIYDFYNVAFTGADYISTGSTLNSYDCKFLGIKPIDTSSTAYYAGVAYGSVFANSTVYLLSQYQQKSHHIRRSNTFYRSNVIFDSTDNLKETYTFNIFSDCNLNFITQANHIDYSLFYHCNFRFGTKSLSTTYYPSVPAGYTYLSTIEQIRAANTAAFGSNANNFNHCKIADPLFTNAGANDFTISPNSPAKLPSYYSKVWGSDIVTPSSTGRVFSIITRYGTKNIIVTATPPPFIKKHGDSVSASVFGSVTNHPSLVQAINGITFTTHAEGGTTVYAGASGTAGHPNSGNFVDYKYLTLNDGYVGQYLSFCYGINDFAYGIIDAAWKSTYKGYIQEYLTAGFPASKLMIEIPPFVKSNWVQYTQTRDIIHEIGDELGILKYDVFQRFVNTNNNDALFIGGAGLHPNQTGQNLWASGYDTFIKR
jgi:hypothetical protein